LTEDTRTQFLALDHVPTPWLNSCFCIIPSLSAALSQADTMNKSPKSLSSPSTHVLYHTYFSSLL